MGKSLPHLWTSKYAASVKGEALVMVECGGDGNGVLNVRMREVA